MLKTIILDPVAQFIGLFALSLLVRCIVMKPGSSPTASGAIVMAIGIFALDALQQLPVGNLATPTQVVALPGR